jgi:DNA-binding transcriptional ArsR family regulator
VSDELPEMVMLSDPRAIRAVAHPARMIVIDALYDQGKSLTATEASALTGISPSAMSYHLRSLEGYGIIKRSASLGDDRQRPWVRAAKNLGIRPRGTPGSTSEMAATETILAWSLDNDRQHLSNAIKRMRGKGDPVALDVVTRHSRATLEITVDEAKVLLAAIEELIDPYRLTVRTDAPSDAGHLSFALTAVADPANPGDGVYVESSSFDV